jgi:hypothetical protein
MAFTDDRDAFCPNAPVECNQGCRSLAVLGFYAIHDVLRGFFP